MTDETRNRWKKRARMAVNVSGCLLAPVLIFYHPFVVQTLWNWFVAPAVHGSELSYWQTFGITFFINVLSHSNRNEVLRERRWLRVTQMLEATVPEEKMEELKKTFAEDDNSWSAILSEINPSTGHVIGSTISLGMGWAIHTFLM